MEEGNRRDKTIFQNGFYKKKKTNSEIYKGRKPLQKILLIETTIICSEFENFSKN